MPSLSVNCPGCNAAVDRDVSLTCDLCGRGMHFSCAGLCADEAVMLRRIQRRSPHFKILCVDCNGVFQSPSLSPVLADQQAYLEENVFLKYVRNIVGKEIDSVKDELSAQIEVLKQSNVDLVKFLTEKRGSVVARALFAVWSHRSAAGSILATSDLASCRSCTRGSLGKSNQRSQIEISLTVVVDVLLYQVKSESLLVPATAYPTTREKCRRYQHTNKRI
jgi:hypothetical protein